jgi:hypothetical protein
LNFTIRYVSSGLTAAATLLVSVQGVVVQTSRFSPGRPFSGNLTNTALCSTSLYPSLTSISLRPTPQRGHHGMAS